MVYTNENQFIVNNVKNLLETEEIETFIKNEFAQGAVGGLSVFEAWPEVWICNDSDFEPAMAIVKRAQEKDRTGDWICKNCFEANDSSFEVCWSCQQNK
jgi:hypothetical protein